MDSLAAGGAPFNRFHVTSLCSPTRASFFTGRNHHAVGMGFLADIPLGFPGYHARLPQDRRPAAPTAARCGVLDAGRREVAPDPALAALGRRALRHLAARPRASSATTASFRVTRTTGPRTWCATTTTSTPPSRPEDGYHLSEDLADQAVRMVQDQQQGAPGKPFFLYFALGAMHAPHHVAPEWVDPYRGLFDKGWDAWREEVFARQVVVGHRAGGDGAHGAAGVGAGLERPHGRRAAAARSPAGGLRRVPHAHRRPDRAAARPRSRTSGRWRTRSSWCSRTTAPAPRGASYGSVERAPVHRAPARVARRSNLAHYDDWGGFSTYNHYSWAWAWAGQHAAQALEALHLAGRDADAADRALGWAHRRPGHRAVAVRRTPST